MNIFVRAIQIDGHLETVANPPKIVLFIAAVLVDLALAHRRDSVNTPARSRQRESVLS